jgi:hypothetical protein
MNRQSRTFRLELLRALPAGVIETLGSTFAVLIAVRHFDLPAATKAMLVSAVAAGHVASLAVVPAARRMGWTPARASAGLYLLAALAFGLVFAAPPQAGLFIACAMAGGFLPPLAGPLLAQIHRSHYQDSRRGRLFAFASLARMATAMTAALLIGRWLDGGMDRYPLLFATYAACAIAAAACLWLIGGEPPPPGCRVPLLGAFRHVRADPAFRKLLAVWMFIGFGNLMAVALFVEFAANPAHGLALSSAQVAALTVTLPAGCAMASILAWGWLFDRAHFYRVRVFINLLFLAGIVGYYAGGSPAWMIAGMALHGFGRAGGDVSWSLWVTKFAPEDQVSEYMSVHTCLTGLRGIIAPFVGFHLIERSGPLPVAWAAAALIALGSLLIFPEMASRRHHHGRPSD